MDDFDHSRGIKNKLSLLAARNMDFTFSSLGKFENVGEMATLVHPYISDLLSGPK